MKRPRSSRQRYRTFVEDYRRWRIKDLLKSDEDEKQLPQSATSKAPEGQAAPEGAEAPAGPGQQASAFALFLGGKRREYLREYVRWLRPHRGAVALVFALALVTAALQMSASSIGCCWTPRWTGRRASRVCTWPAPRFSASSSSRASSTSCATTGSAC
jgi:hypothetical protein